MEFILAINQIFRTTSQKQLQLVILEINIVILDISIFVGARSEMNSRNWFWGDSDLVLGQDYSLSKFDQCEQMSLPLTYFDRINLKAKDCVNSQAFAVCHSLCKLNCLDFDITAWSSLGIYGCFKIIFVQFFHNDD